MALACVREWDFAVFAVTARWLCIQQASRSGGQVRCVGVAAEEDSKRCGDGLQKYEDWRWCLLCVGALLKKLQKYAVWSWWLLGGGALVERLRDS
jgi:hypothetical protein